MTIDTSLIWQSLGSFWDMFPEEEKIYWSTFWEAYAEIVSDLWGFAFQVDRGKSLFDTTATFERRSTLIVLSGLEQSPPREFRLSRVWQQSGKWLVRGFVPRESRNFRAADIRQTGILVIGSETIEYLSANVSTVVGGVYNGFVQEAVFTLSRAPENDYADSLEINDSFDSISFRFATRIAHANGDTVVDAVLLSVNDQPSINPTGRIVLGVAGVNAESLIYDSFSVVGDRYLFTLAPGQVVNNAHVQGEFLSVTAYDNSAWSQSAIGSALWYANNSATAAVGYPLSGETILSSRREFPAASDFDVSVSMTPQSLPAMAVDGGVRVASARMRIGADRYVVGIRSTRVAGVVTDYLVYGQLGSETSEILSSLPLSVDMRFSRSGSNIDLYVKFFGDSDWRLVRRLVAANSFPAAMEMFVQSLDAGRVVVSFDEVVRRDGAAAGSTRLESGFSVNAAFPYTYTCDQIIASAPSLADRPRTRSEPLTVAVDVDDPNQKFIRAVPAPGFEKLGLPSAGVLSVSGRDMVYDRVVLRNGVYEFTLREKISPFLIPTAPGTAVTASTRVLSESVDYQFDGLGKVSFRSLATRDRMWAPVAQVDERHIQNFYGVLTDASSERSTDQYLSRVQGTWAALTNGPAIGNVHTGLHLAMGLPVARADGIVRSISETRDGVGRLLYRTMFIAGVDGEFEYRIPGTLPLISWQYGVGDEVQRFDPLTNGVEVLDYQSDPMWHTRFPGVAELERFNSFGVFVAIEALSTASNPTEAVRFALRVKPSYTKLIIRFLLTTSGREFLPPQDDTFAVHVPRFCDDIGFDYGQPPPEDLLTTRRLGDGYRLGAGFRLGPYGLWSYLPLGTEVVMFPASADGSWSLGSPVFTSAGAWTFTSADVGHFIRIPTGPDAGTWQIVSVVSGSQVTLEHVFSASSPSPADWRLVDIVDLGDGTVLGSTVAFACHPTDMGRGNDNVEYQQLVTISSSP